MCQENEIADPVCPVFTLAFVRKKALPLTTALNRLGQHVLNRNQRVV